MSGLSSCLYHGEVGHRRLAPLQHEFRYRVYNVFLDIDELPEIGKRLALFGYNRFNLFSISDKDHGPGDGTSIRDHVWSLVRGSEASPAVERVFMFCYPRVLGRVFNPLTVYYAVDREGALKLVLYEVNNTYGQRHTYVIPTDGGTEQSCSKELYVSPFNAVEGHYAFTVQPPGDTLKLAILLSTADGPRINAWFSGKRRKLSDGSLLLSFLGLPLLPLKVFGGIHWEAAKLWLKGLRQVERPAAAEPNVSFARSAKKQ